jgi:hypothetical protein
MVTTTAALIVVTVLARKPVALLVTHLGFYMLCMATIVWRPEQAKVLRHLRPDPERKGKA